MKNAARSGSPDAGNPLCKREALRNCLAAGMAVGLSFGAFADDAYVEANEGSGSFFKIEPEGGTIDIGGSATLRAYAPGAVKYRWTKDGEVLAETTADTLAVDWARRPRESVYGVTPIYSIFGHEVEGEGVTATLENVPLGLAIFLK